MSLELSIDPPLQPQTAPTNTAQQLHRSRTQLRFRRSVPNLRARSTSPAHRNSTRITITEVIGSYIQGNSQMQILSDFEKYRTYIFSKARRLREFTQRISKEDLAAMTTDNGHFNIGLSHIIMKMVQGGELDVNFDNLKREVFDKIESWIIDWVKRKLEYKAANRRLAEQQRTMNQMFADFYKQLNNKKYEPFP